MLPSSSKAPFTEIAREAVKNIQAPLLLYGIVESIVLVFLLMAGQDVPSGLLPLVYALAVFIVLIAAGHFGLEYYSIAIPSRSQEPIKQRGFACSDSPEFHACMKDLMRKAHDRLVLIGTGLNILHRDPFMMEVIDRAAQGHCRLEIYLADPTNPAVETRLIEEELGKVKPPIGRDGIRSRLKTLLRAWKQHGHPDTVSIKLFTHYPTFALIIIDREYFTYPYGYATLGNFSPVLRFSGDAPADRDVVEFLNQQYERVKAHAIDADVSLAIQAQKSARVEALYPFALYFVPPADSSLYQFGTQVLGYDIRKREFKHSPWQDWVGGAREFGFHLTLCDALYFLNEAQAKSAEAEIKFLTEEFRSFDLTNLRLRPNFPDASSLSIVMSDPSGSLEALHSELVHRVYRRAAASNYSLGLAKPTRDPDQKRARLMIDRYRAPYILQRFYPHFTLLTGVPSREQSEIHQECDRIFSEQVTERTIRVEKLAVMYRPALDAPWEIKEEMKLG